MITVEEATRIIQSALTDFGSESVILSKASGRVLKEDLFADRDFPPFDRVTMDGIAIRHSAYASGQRTFSVHGIAPAGTGQLTLSSPDECIEVMTGAILPSGTDTVIRYEDLDIQNGEARILIEGLREGINVHYRGEDRKKDSLIVAKNRLLSSAEIGVAATIGKGEIQVAKLPSVTIVTTGDEIVPVDARPLPHQIRGSNVMSMHAALGMPGIRPHAVHLPDDKNHIREVLAHILTENDVLILSGGVSKGKYDFVPEALDLSGVVKHFHKIKQRPGKPFWFGTHPEGCVVFALPGNPVSALMCTYRYILPWIQECMGVKPIEIRAQLNEDVHFSPDLVYFLQVRTWLDSNGIMQAGPVAGGGSGDLANMVDADGFLELPRGREIFRKGEVFRFFGYR